ncbi:hypothetical protein [Paraliomyxa miuraensis]|uniref:hypothetical protein n=1 Tax=Paraliomyxa miuraensis TaxID=376150 RepID=UPI00224ECA41|nr:hypothetical protein [Paraliomyxa miuraensis]MCX4243678.1 hypothetical protein [Paraliomyxa miuraensis]
MLASASKEDPPVVHHHPRAASEAEYLDLLLALVTALRTTVVMARGNGVWDESSAAVQG